MADRVHPNVLHQTDTEHGRPEVRLILGAEAVPLEFLRRHGGDGGSADDLGAGLHSKRN